MKLTTNGRKARGSSLPDRRELVQLERYERRYEDQTELVARFEQRRVALEQHHVDARLALETGLQVALTKLEAELALELAKLWRAQGRRLGPYAAWLLDREERANGAKG